MSLSNDCDLWYDMVWYDMMWYDMIPVMTSLLWWLKYSYFEFYFLSCIIFHVLPYLPYYCLSFFSSCNHWLSSFYLSIYLSIYLYIFLSLFLTFFLFFHFYLNLYLLISLRLYVVPMNQKGFGYRQNWSHVYQENLIQDQVQVLLMPYLFLREIVTRWQHIRSVQVK